MYEVINLFIIIFTSYMIGNNSISVPYTSLKFESLNIKYPLKAAA